MDVGCGQKFAATCLDPAFTSAGLTLRAMAVAATVIGDGSAMSTTLALIDVAAECGRTTTRNSVQDFKVRPTEPLTVARMKAVPAARTRSATSRGGRSI